MRSITGAPAPWHAGNQLSLAFLSLLGFGGIVLSWWMVAGSAQTATQQGWLDVGVVALLVAATGDALYLLNGRRAVQRGRRALALRMAALAGDDTAAGGVSPDFAAGLVVTTPKMSRYHRAGCLLVQGKPVAWGSVAENVRAGRRPCGVCTP